MAFLHGNVRTCASDLVSHSFVCLLSAVCCQSFSLPLFSFLTFPALSLSLRREEECFGLVRSCYLYRYIVVASLEEEEFMILPVGAASFKEAMIIGADAWQRRHGRAHSWKPEPFPPRRCITT